MEIADVWRSAPVAWAAGVAVLGALYKSVKALLEFNDEYLRKRRLKHLSFLQSEAKDDAELEMFLRSAKHEELFRAVFGRPASRATSAAVLALHASGRFSVEELRSSAPYWKFQKSGCLDIQSGAAGTFVLWASAFFVLMIGIYVAAVVVKLLAIKSVVGLVGAALFVLIFSMVVLYFGRDMRAVLLARRAEKELKRMRERDAAVGDQPTETVAFAHTPDGSSSSETGRV